MNPKLEELALRIGVTHAALMARGGDLGEQLLELYARVSELEQLEPPPYDPPPPGGDLGELVEPFAPGSPYAYLPDVPKDATALGWYPTWINNSGPGEPFDLAQIAPGDYAGSNEASSWGDHGPTWAANLYRVTGRLEGARFFRVGDFTKGREGHALYLRPTRGNVELVDVEAVGCGAQHTQARVSADEVPPELWPLPTDTFSHVRARAIQCGAIQAGSSPRASWPRSFFNTGSRYRAEDCYTQTDHTGHAPAGATGAVLLGFGKERLRGELAELLHEQCALRGSDRATVFLEGWDAVRLDEPDLRELDRSAARVRIVDGCGRVEILHAKAPVLVEFAHASTPADPTAPHRAPYRTEYVGAGASWGFDGI